MIKAFKTAPATIVNTYTYTFTERDIRIAPLLDDLRQGN